MAKRKEAKFCCLPHSLQLGCQRWFPCAFTQRFCWLPLCGMGSPFLLGFYMWESGWQGLRPLCKVPVSGPFMEWLLYLCWRQRGWQKRRMRRGKSGVTVHRLLLTVIPQPSTRQLVIVQILGAYCVPAAPHVLFFTYQENPAKWHLSSFYRWKVESWKVKYLAQLWVPFWAGVPSRVFPGSHLVDGVYPLTQNLFSCLLMILPELTCELLCY